MKPPTFIECTVCGREFGSKSIVIHERQCLQKLRRTEINQESQHVASGPGKSTRRKKKVGRPIESAIEPTISPMKKSPESPQPHILLPKINTKNRKSSIRPTTATLPKPKFLNPEYIQHDMSLTRIDYATAQLRLDDDENQNMRSSRQNFVLPVVQATKSKQPSPGKFSSNERRTIKLPDSMKINSTSDSKKQNGVESSASVMLPNTEISTSCHLRLAQKSQSFPLLSLHSPNYSSDFVTKRMKANEKHFPQITNDRSLDQPSSNYKVTRASRQPNWDYEKGRQLSRECYPHLRHFFGVSQEGDVIQNSPEKDGLEFLHEDFDESVPEVIFLRNSESLGALSQQSFGTSDDNTFETLVKTAISNANAKLHTSEAEISTRDINLKTAIDFDELSSHISLCNKQNSDPDPMDKWVASGFLLQNSPKNTITTVSFALPLIPIYEKKLCAGAWLYTDSNSLPTPSPKSILKRRARSEHSSSNVSTTALPRSRNLRKNGTFSGSDCDNESTSSGYGFLRAVSTRTMLQNKKERQRCVFTAPPAFNRIVDSYSPPSSLDAVHDSLDSIGAGALLNELNRLTQKRSDSDENDERPPPFSKSMSQIYDKVNNWLLGCSHVAVCEGIEPKIFAKKSNEPNVSLYRRSDEDVHNADVDLNFEEGSEQSQSSTKVSDRKENYGKIISGLVSAIFKVKELDETRTYKFVNKMVTKVIGKSSLRELTTAQPTSRLEVKSSKNLNSPTTTNTGPYQCYAPPKCLKSNKRVVEMLKQLKSSAPLSKSMKRPTTSPHDTFSSSLARLQSSQKINGPKTVEPQQLSHEKTEVLKSSSQPIPNKCNVVKDSNKTQHPCPVASKVQNARPLTPLTKLVFGPQSSLSTLKKTTPAGNNTTGKRDLNLKLRPLTPRPQFPFTQTQLVLDNQGKPRNNLKRKFNKSSQIPETRSTYAQYSPEAQNKTLGSVTTHPKVSESTKPKVTFPSNKPNVAETNFKNTSSFPQSQKCKNFNTSTNTTQRKEKTPAYHNTHLIYQFHSTLKNLSSAGDVQYGSDLQDDGQDKKEEYEMCHDSALHTITIHSTYTLLVPKYPQTNQIMDLNVVIRRRNIEDPEEPSGECASSSMFLIIDEMKEITAFPAHVYGEICDSTYSGNLTPQIKQALRQMPRENLSCTPATCSEDQMPRSLNVNIDEPQIGSIRPTKSIRVNLSPSFFQLT